MGNKKLIGPFTQIITLDRLPMKGPIKDDELEIISSGGILIEGDRIIEVGRFSEIRNRNTNAEILEISTDTVALPGFIDPHTHICFAGSRANDYAMRIAGKSYLEIAKEGGGIWQTVQNTRKASSEELLQGTLSRANTLLKSGITTAEVKSGYGLNLKDELKMLRIIQAVDGASKIDLVSTCLAAHIVPKDFERNSIEYLAFIFNELLPIVKKEKLSNRVDIFIEEGAFASKESTDYLHKAKALGFELTIHGDQFTASGSLAAIETGALSVDHLESSTSKEIMQLAKSDVVATVLPGASIGLGMQFAPARQMLDAGCCVAIGSDWNPGSAPMGNLLTQTAIMSASEKISNAEAFAGITFRAAKALNLHDRGMISNGKIANFIGFPCTDYREILYHQGQLHPNIIFKKGIKIH